MNRNRLAFGQSDNGFFPTYSAANTPSRSSCFTFYNTSTNLNWTHFISHFHCLADLRFGGAHRDGKSIHTASFSSGAFFTHNRMNQNRNRHTIILNVFPKRESRLHWQLQTDG